MELGQYEIQIFISLVVILGAAFVALICDFLKGNNERLRELAIELNVRREEQEWRAPRAAAMPEKTFEAPAPPVVKREVPKKPQPRKEQPVTQEIVKREVAGARPKAPAALPAPAPKIEMKRTGPKKDWQSLLARSAVKRVPNKTKIEKIVCVAPAAPHTLPAGFQDAAALGRMMRERHRVSGLVVSIGASGARRADGSMPDALVKLIASLVKDGELACASGDEEFLLICPDERGAEGQRRLSLMAQTLWDFQLRSLGTLPVVFSWGGLEVKNEAIEEAVAAARDRMAETRRGRKTLSPKLLEMEPRRLRAAV
jgi:hypothetical protein